MDEIERFYMDKPEPLRACLLSFRDLIIRSNPLVSETRKYGMPFFCLQKKMFCYLWVEKKSSRPYIGIVEGRKLNHPRLIQEKRSRMKIMLVDPTKDLPVKTILSILKKAAAFYDTGVGPIQQTRRPKRNRK